MDVAKIDAALCERCDQCHAALSCPKEIIRYNGPNPQPGVDLLEIDVRQCLGCGKCERACLGKAVTMG